MLSYGTQMPFGRNGKPREGMDPRMPICSDKGPFFEAAALQAGSGWTPDQPRAVMQDPNFSLTETQLMQMSTDRWRPYNSRNHNSEGQDVLFTDGHVDFQKRPICGVNYDNIFTRQGDYTLLTSLQGKKPIDKEGPYTNTDAVIIP